MYKLILPTRYFLRRRIAILAIAAVALCVFMVVVVMTVMSGLVDDFRQKNHSFFGDCIVSSQSLVGFAYYEDFARGLEEREFVESVSVLIRTVGLLSKAGASWNMPVEVVGVDPVAHSRVTSFGESLYYNRDDLAKAYMPKHAPELDGCVLGIDMLGNRGPGGEYYHSDQPGHIEVKVSCFPLTAKGNLLKGGIGGEIVNTKGFFYSDDSHSGLVRVDSNTVYLSFERVQNLCGMGGKNKRASAIHIKFADEVSAEKGSAKVAVMWDEFKADRVASAETSSEKTYAGLLGNVVVQSWKSYRRESIAPMEKEQTMMTMVFAMLGIITVFIILVVFYMIISSKSKDIGILKSMGISTGSVISVFLVFAGFIGFIGTAIGMAGGCAFLVKINDIEDWLHVKYQWQLWDRSVYAIGDIPNNIEWQSLAVIGIFAVTACFVGALIPSYQAARRQVAQTLQVDQL